MPDTMRTSVKRKVCSMDDSLVDGEEPPSTEDGRLSTLSFVCLPAFECTHTKTCCNHNTDKHVTIMAPTHKCMYCGQNATAGATLNDLKTKTTFDEVRALTGKLLAEAIASSRELSDLTLKYTGVSIDRTTIQRRSKRGHDPTRWRNSFMPAG